MDSYSDLLDKYRFDPEWDFVGRGQNGSVYKKGNVAIKITTDEVELEHAEMAEDYNKPSLAPISNVNIIHQSLGTYEMPVLKSIPGTAEDTINKYHREITEYIETGDSSVIASLPKALQKFFSQVRKDFQSIGIPLDETDIQGANVMQDSRGNLKLIDY